MQKTTKLLGFLLLFSLIGMGVAGALAEPAPSPLNVPEPQMTEDPNPGPPTSVPTGPDPDPVTTNTTTTNTVTTTSSVSGPFLADLGPNGVVYTDRGNIVIYGVDSNSRGFVALVVTADEIASVSASPSKNTLIVRDGIYEVYRLTTGELQVNVGPVANGEVFEVVFENSNTNKARVTSFGAK